MSKTFEEPQKDARGVLQFYSPCGEKVREKYVWNEDQTDLVLKEKIDIVKEMNERAKGTSIVEQIARLERGDTSVIDPSRVTPDDFECDLSGMPEHPIEVIDMGVRAQAALMDLKVSEEKAAADRAEIKALQEQLIAKKAEYDAAVAALDAKKQPVKKDGED